MPEELAVGSIHRQFVKASPTRQASLDQPMATSGSLSWDSKRHEAKGQSRWWGLWRRRCLGGNGSVSTRTFAKIVGRVDIAQLTPIKFNPPLERTLISTRDKPPDRHWPECGLLLTHKAKAMLVYDNVREGSIATSNG